MKTDVNKKLVIWTFLLAFFLAPLAAQQAAEKVELKLKLPKPMFIGTPTNIKSPNLEVVTGKAPCTRRSLRRRCARGGSPDLSREARSP